MTVETRLLDLTERDGELALVLEGAPFYSDGAGGQLGDRGTVEGIPVVAVPNDGTGAVIVNMSGEKVGTDGQISLLRSKKDSGPKLVVTIDEFRREDIACQHSAQHLLSALFLKEYAMKTASFHMGEGSSTIDLECSESTDLSVVMGDVLAKADNIVREGRQIRSFSVPYEELGNYQLRKISDKMGPGMSVKLVVIEGVDTTACGGFHVDNTAKLGCIGVTGSEKVKGGLLRLHYMAGKRYTDHLQRRSAILDTIERRVNAAADTVAARVSLMADEAQSARKMYVTTAKRYAEMAVGKLTGTVLSTVDDEAIIEAMADYCRNTAKKPFIGITEDGKKGIAVSPSLTKEMCATVLASVKKISDVRGGGGNGRMSFFFETPLAKTEADAVCRSVAELLEDTYKRILA